MIENNSNYNKNILKIKSFITGGFLVLWGRKEINVLAEQVLDTEEIIYSAIGSMDGEWGTFVITDKRVLFASNVIDKRNMKTTTVYHADITKISIVGPSILKTGKKLEVYGKDFSFIIEAKNEAILALKKNIDVQVLKSKQGVASSIHCADIESELAKFKLLVEKGLITEEEFAAKRKQLLGI